MFKNNKIKNDLTPIKKSQRTCNWNNKSASLNNVDVIDTEERKADKNKCLMCCENDQNAVFMNCGHGGKN